MLPRRLRFLRPCAIAIALLSLTATSARAADRQILTYEIALGPLPVFLIDADLSLKRETWQLQTQLATAPLFQKLYGLTSNGQAEGRRVRGIIIGGTYDVTASTLDRVERVRLEYRDGGALPVRVEPPRPEGPDLAARGALDPYATLVAVVETVQRTGRCPESILVFDGWRRFEAAVTAAPDALIPKIPRALYAGPALECRLLIDDPKAAQRGPSDYLGYVREASLFIARVAEASAPVPVLVQTAGGTTPFRMILTGASVR